MARLVAPLVTRLTALLGLMALVCVVGSVFSIRSVDAVDDGRSAVDAQRAVSADAAAMQASLDAYVRTGDPTERTAFAAAARRVDRDLDDLEAAVVGDDPLTGTVGRERSAISAWYRTYAAVQVAATAPTTGANPLFRRGRTLFTDITVTGRDVESALDLRASDAVDAAILRFRLTVVAALVLLGLSWYLVGRARGRLLGVLSEPLTRLERVVARMLRNDPEGRADQENGPKEVRAIARALNDFADAQSRARAVEGRIQDELHVLDSAKDDFVSNVSHELRTPLTTISGYLEMVAEEFEGRLEPRHERMLDATRRNVTRLRALIDDLLALSKAQVRAGELEASDVAAMIAEAVTDVKISAARRGIAVDLDVPGDPLLVVCDRAMLHRAFLNVLTNAVKFSHDGGRVEVAVRRRGARVELAVSDHGIGIPRAELDRLGTRFFRASNAMSNEIAGTGLGLRIVQTIIDHHNGDVVIESAEGEGTTVFVRLRLHGAAVSVAGLGEGRTDGGPDPVGVDVGVGGERELPGAASGSVQ